MEMLFVTYSGNPDARFNRDHYTGMHLPLVERAWRPFGMESIGAFFPAGGDSGLIAVCVMRFRDEEAIRNAIRSAATAEVMADVYRFTDAKPVQSRAVLV